MLRCRGRDSRSLLCFVAAVVLRGRLCDPRSWSYVAVVVGPLCVTDPNRWRRRIGAQVSDDARRAIADVVIDTSGTAERTLEQVDALWESLATA